MSAVMCLAFVLLKQCARIDALLLPPGQHGRITNTLPGSIFSASSPQVWPAVSLKLVLYFTLNAAGSQNYAHCSLLFLALRFPHLPTKICSPSENGLYFLTARKHLSHRGCGAVGCHTSEPSSLGQGSGPFPSLTPLSSHAQVASASSDLGQQVLWLLQSLFVAFIACFVPVLLNLLELSLGIIGASIFLSFNACDCWVRRNMLFVPFPNNVSVKSTRTDYSSAAGG